MLDLGDSGWTLVGSHIERSKKFADRRVQFFQRVEKIPFVMKDLELVIQLGHDQHRSPRFLLLRFDDISEYVIANVQHIFAHRSDQFRDDLTRAFERTELQQNSPTRILPPL